MITRRNPLGRIN